MARPRTLDPVIGVRIPAPQLFFGLEDYEEVSYAHHYSAFYILRSN